MTEHFHHCTKPAALTSSTFGPLENTSLRDAHCTIYLPLSMQLKLPTLPAGEPAYRQSGIFAHNLCLHGDLAKSDQLRISRLPKADSSKATNPMRPTIPALAPSVFGTAGSAFAAQTEVRVLRTRPITRSGGQSSAGLGASASHLGL